VPTRIDLPGILQPTTNTIKSHIPHFSDHWNLKFDFRLLEVFGGDKEYQNIINLIEYDGVDSGKYKIVFDVDIQRNSGSIIILKFSCSFIILIFTIDPKMQWNENFGI